ncbi:MAG: type II toxin-antitoxin system RelE/ParE family toxin [Clostridia bacterium]|nr:type II toxin-antitoxin system RelE/ParE family toxin [Clostridia bacterium]
MSYRIHITKTAEADMNSAIDYIEQVLFNPQAADNLLDETDAQIQNLSNYPAKYPLVDDPVLKAQGIRFVPVKNYLVFYRISETDKTIHIVRFLYARRNWVSILKKGRSLG